MKGVLALPGAFIPGTGITLKEGEIRGVKSQAMLLSTGQRWASATTTPASSICPRTPPSARATSNGRGWMTRSSRSRSPPTRGDALSVRGVARDLAAAGFGTLKPWTVETVAAAYPPRCIGASTTCAPASGCSGARCAASQRAVPQMAAGPAGGDRAAPDQRAGRCDELLHLRRRPPAARLQHRRGRRHRPRDAHGARWRATWSR